MIKSNLKKTAMLLQTILPESIPKIFTGDFVPIFMLHRIDHPDFQITGCNIKDLRECLEYFRINGYRAITLEALANAIINQNSLPPKTAVFTIDDGFIDQFDIAAPLFSEYDIPLTFFLITNFIEKKIWPWDDQISYILDNARIGDYKLLIDGRNINIYIKDEESRRKERNRLRNFIKSVSNNRLYDELDSIYLEFDIEQPVNIPNKYLPMSWDNARVLSSNEHKISPHTTTHRILSQLSDLEFEKEIQNSIDKINDEIDNASPVFAYPTGRPNDFTEREIAYLVQSDIVSTVSTVHGSAILGNTKTSYLHSLPRYSMPDNLLDFRQYLSWVEVLKDKLRN